MAKKSTKKEKEFDVLVSRISYSSRTITVKAKNKKEAERLALDLAGDFEFREHDADYVSDGVTEKE